MLKLIHAEINFENTVTECLIKPLIKYVDKFQVASELYEIYFICIAKIRKDATYGDLITIDKQLILFQDAIKDRLTFLYHAAVLQDNLEPFLRIWSKLISKKGDIILPPF